DEFGDGRGHRRLARFEPLELAVQPHAIENGQQQQQRDQAFDRQGKDVAHGASMRLLDPSAFSNMAKVVCGLRKGLATRTATRSPIRPMRPSLSVTWPQRTLTSASDLTSSISVSPTLSPITRLSGSLPS